MLLNESSSNVISLASLATEVPVPIESPTCAWFKAGASFVPSPVTATTAPFCWSSCTKRCLSVGRARDIIFKSITRSKASSSVRSANAVPVIRLRSVSSGFQSPICRAISVAVPGVSPVTILTSMPADWHFATAAGTSGRIGSEMATTPKKFRSFSATNATQSSGAWSSTILKAKPKVRIAIFWYPNNCSSTVERYSVASIRLPSSTTSLHFPNTISGAPFIYNTFFPMRGDCTNVAINLRSVEKVSWSNTPACSRNSK